jgi:hypothetical protein
MRMSWLIISVPESGRIVQVTVLSQIQNRIWITSSKAAGIKSLAIPIPILDCLGKDLVHWNTILLKSGSWARELKKPKQKNVSISRRVHPKVMSNNVVFGKTWKGCRNIARRQDLARTSTKRIVASVPMQDFNSIRIPHWSAVRFHIIRRETLHLLPSQGKSEICNMLTPTGSTSRPSLERLEWAKPQLSIPAAKRPWSKHAARTSTTKLYALMCARRSEPSS